MLKTLLVLMIAAVGASCALATDYISGSIGWVNGIATATITPSTALQTIVLKVGTTNVTYKDILVVGDSGSPITSGSTVGLMVAGSQPFAATFSAGATISAFSGYGGTAGIDRRTVPITTTGVIQDGIAFQETSGIINLQLLLPNCNIAGTYLFYGGVDIGLNVELAKYSVALPGPSVASGVSTVVFPTASLAENLLEFVAAGESTMEVFGQSSSTNVYCSGQFTGTVATFTTAELVATSHYEN